MAMINFEPDDGKTEIYELRQLLEKYQQECPPRIVVVEPDEIGKLLLFGHCTTATGVELQMKGKRGKR